MIPFISSPLYLRAAGHRQVYLVPLASADLCSHGREQTLRKGQNYNIQVHARLLFSDAICSRTIGPSKSYSLNKVKGREKPSALKMYIFLTLPIESSTGVVREQLIVNYNSIY